MPSVKLMWSFFATLFTQLCLGFYSLETPLEEKLLLMRIWPTFFLSILSILPSYLLLWNRPHICLMTMYCVLRSVKARYEWSAIFWSSIAIAIFFSRSAIAIWSKDRRTIAIAKFNDRDRKNVIAIFLAFFQHQPFAGQIFQKCQSLKNENFEKKAFG